MVSMYCKKLSKTLGYSGPMQECVGYHSRPLGYNRSDRRCPFRVSIAVGDAVLKGRQTLHHLGKVLRLFRVSDPFKNLPKAKKCFLNVHGSAKLRGSCTELRLRW